MEPFKYPDTLVEKVKHLAQEMMEKNEALVFTQTYLSRVEFYLYEANRSLDPIRKRI